MADLNALIAQGYQPQAPQNPFVQYAQMQQLQQGEQANQLNQMKMQEYERGLQEQNALRSVVGRPGFDPMNPTHQANAFAAAPSLAPTYIEKALTTRETVSKIGKTGAETKKIDFETQIAKANKAITDITSLSNPQDAAASIDAHLANGDITADKAAMLKNALSSAPSFGDWQKKMVMGILDAKEQLTMTAPKPTEMRLGNVVKTIDMNPNSPTYKQEVLPPQPIAMSEYEKAHIPILQQGANAASTSAAAAASNATNAVARLNFDKTKVQWERDNPGFNIEKVDQADGTTQFVAIDKRTRQATPINMAPPAAPAGVGRGSVGVTDTTAGVPLVGVSNKPLTESQGNATAFGMRMKESNDLLKKLENVGERNTGVVSGAVKSVVGLTPFIGDKLSDMTGDVFNVLPSIVGGLSSEQQQVQNARINFITAVLRKESGASISPSEFITAEKLYFPKPGESDTVVKQKQRARDLAIEAMKIQAGPGAKSIGAPSAAGGASVSVGESANDPLGIRR
jgi:hypothetical protein